MDTLAPAPTATHVLEVSEERNYGGYLDGTCSQCFDPDWDGEKYVTGGQYMGFTLGEVQDSFLDDHAEYPEELVSLL